jgi:hypothetical protein
MAPAARAAGDRGSATVETALALPSLVLVAVALAGALAALAGQIRCVDAARLAARASARGEDPAAITAAVAEDLPWGRVVVDRDGDFVRATVTTPVLGLPLLRGFTVRAGAEELAEDDDDTS